MATLKTSVFNLTETLINTIRVYRQQGAVLASESRQVARMDSCSNCEKLSEKGICNVCACYMNLKVRLEAAKCPLGKW